MCRFCVGSSTFNNAPSPTRRTALGKMGALSLLGMSAVAGSARALSPPRPENELSPEQAIKRLIEGNERYVSGKINSRSFAETRAALASGQNPYASILGCADSRVSPELCFDEERGDLFVARVAGNYVTRDILASLEYGVAVLASPLIMVLGQNVQQLQEATPILSTAVNAGKVKVVGGLYHLDTGQVELVA